MMRNLLHFPLPGVQPQLARRLEHHRTEILRQWRQLTPQVIPLANLARRYRVREHTLSRVIKAWVGALRYLDITQAKSRGEGAPCGPARARDAGSSGPGSTPQGSRACAG
jgi:hypothetical protein